jgi:uncharacterized protein
MRSNKMILIVAMAVTAALLVLAGCAPIQTGSTADNVKEIKITTGEDVKKNTITASGLGEIKIKPDVSYITVGVTTESGNAKRAESDNRDRMNALYASVKALGITEDDIKTVSYYLSPKYDYSTPKAMIVGYTASNIVEITVKDVAKAGEVIDAAVSGGGNELQSIRFDLLDKSKAYADALDAAVKDAKAKVDVMAKAAGVTEYKPMNIVESSVNSSPVYYPAADMAKGEAAAAPTPISTGEMTITANVSVEYEIVK